MISRNIQKELEKFFHRKEVLAIIWPRQVWKSTILKKIKEENFKNNSFYFDFEDNENLNSFSKNPVQFIKNFKIKDQKTIFFFDEIQLDLEAWKNLKLIYDTFWDEIKIFISWSSSLEIREISSKMVWRIFIFEMWSVSFDEFLKYKNIWIYNEYKNFNLKIKKFISNWEKIDLKISDNLIFSESIKKYFEEYLIWWWYPEIVLEENIEMKKMILKNIIQTYLNKDIVWLLNIRDVKWFENFLITISLLIWEKINYQERWNDLNLDFRTLKKYLDLLQKTFLIHEISPYFTNKISEIIKEKLNYFYDLWIRNSVIRNFQEPFFRLDTWHLVENFAFLRLKNLELENLLWINYWRDKQWNEVDFILDFWEKKFPIEIKFQNFKKEKISNSTKNFINKYSPENFLIFTKNFFWEIEFKGTKILFIPIYYL